MNFGYSVVVPKLKLVTSTIFITISFYQKNNYLELKKELKIGGKPPEKALNHLWFEWLKSYNYEICFNRLKASFSQNLISFMTPKPALRDCPLTCSISVHLVYFIPKTERHSTPSFSLFCFILSWKQFYGGINKQ